VSLFGFRLRGRVSLGLWGAFSRFGLRLLGICKGRLFGPQFRLKIRILLCHHPAAIFALWRNLLAFQAQHVSLPNVFANRAITFIEFFHRIVFFFQPPTSGLAAVTVVVENRTSLLEERCFLLLGSATCHCSLSCLLLDYYSSSTCELEMLDAKQNGHPQIR